jgi:hypothetical protein
MTFAATDRDTLPTARKRVSERLRKTLLTAHLISAVGLVGLAIALSVLGLAGMAGADPETIYPAMHLLARAVLVPLGIVAFVIGVTQAVLTGYGLMRHRWVTAKIGILGLLVTVAITMAVPGLGRAADAATTPGVEVAAAQQITAIATPTAALVLFVVAASLGVFKPGRRRRK